MSCATKIILLFLLASFGLTATPPARSQQYTAQTDFEAGWIAGNNPNGVWRYGWSEGLTGPLTLFTRHYIPPIENNQEQMWDDPLNTALYTPSVRRNPGRNYADGNVTFMRGALILHYGGVNWRAYSHVVWTAPEAGTYHLDSLFFGQQNGLYVDVHVLVNGAAVFNATMTINGIVRAYKRVFTLAAGDTIDFAVGPNGRFTPHPGSTGLQARITKLAVGGSTPTLLLDTAECKNLTTAQVVSIALDEVSVWDCENAGLAVQPGDSIEIKVRGQVR